MSRPRVLVVGGGLAGLQAALGCADGGAEVTLVESRARLGGATWSTHMNGLAVDNGQHVFLRCCDRYVAFLERVGALELATIQPRLEVPVVAPGQPTAWIRRSPLPSPAHLAPSLLGFHPLSWPERLRAALTARKLGALDPDDRALDELALGPWLEERGESSRAIDVFWDLLVRPTLNLPAHEASLALAAKVFRTGLLGRSDAADIGWGRVPFADLHEGPAAEALEKVGVTIRRRAEVTHLSVEDGKPVAWCDGERLAADAVVLAVPHARAADLLPAESGVDRDGLRALGATPIVNLHVVFDRAVLPHELVCAIDSPLQWMFDRTGPAGLDEGQYVTVSLSAGASFVGRSREDLRAVFLPAFEALFPAARRALVREFFVTVERDATFRQTPGTRRYRPQAETAVPGLYLAGAYTDTGWPATMEGAVRSGEAAAAAALAGLRHGRGASKEAA